MSNILDKLKAGDLIAIAYNNSCNVGIFHKVENSLQYFMVATWVLEALQKKGVTKAYKYYICSPGNRYRVLKITEDSLTDEDLVIYKKMKEIYEKS